MERYFYWSFYSQGTRTEGDNARTQTAADATVFVAAALKFLGDAELADGPEPAWDKGARLAELVARHRTLLILDGLEPLQHPPGPQQGKLKDMPGWLRVSARFLPPGQGEGPVFAAVAEQPKVLRNSTNCPLYLLCFAVGNEQGAPIALRIACHLLKQGVQ